MMSTSNCHFGYYDLFQFWPLCFLWVEVRITSLKLKYFFLCLAVFCRSDACYKIHFEKYFKCVYMCIQFQNVRLQFNGHIDLPTQYFGNFILSSTPVAISWFINQFAVYFTLNYRLQCYMMGILFKRRYRK